MNTKLITNAQAITIANMELPTEVPLAGQDSYDFDKTKVVGIEYPTWIHRSVNCTPAVLKQVVGRGGRIWPRVTDKGVKNVRPDWRYNALGEAWRFIWRAADMPSPHTSKKSNLTVFRIDLMIEAEPSRLDPVDDLDEMLVVVANDEMSSLAVIGYPLRDDHHSVGNVNAARDVLNVLYSIQASGKPFEEGQKAGRYAIKTMEQDNRVLRLVRG